MRTPLARRLAPLLLVLHSRLALATGGCASWCEEYKEEEEAPREEQEGLVGGGDDDEEEITMA